MSYTNHERLRDTNSGYQASLTPQFAGPAEQYQSHLDLNAAQKYVYEPLKSPEEQFRLMYLLPENITTVRQTKNPVFQCQVLTYPVNHAPPYTALSYVYGPPDLSRQLMINGNMLPITENLAVALGHLQERDQTLVLWVDAVCINQQNDDEKSKQVQIMGQIYSSASLVVVWLGVGDDLSNEIFQITEDLRQNPPHPVENKSVDEDWSLIYSNLTRFPLEKVERIRLFLSERPWFSRVWVIQEYCLAQDVIFICGTQEASWRSFTETIRIGAAVPLIFRGLSPPLPTSLYEQDFLGPSKFNTFLRIYDDVCWVGNMQAKNPRDFIYAFFGMITDLTEQSRQYSSLRADYSKSVVEVYTDFAHNFFGRIGLTTISKYWRPSARFPHLPSWVPDWSAIMSLPDVDRPDWAGDLTLDYLTMARIWHLDDGSRILRIRGLHIGTVQRIEYSWDWEHMQRVSPRERLAHLVHKLRQVIASSPSRLDASQDIDQIVYDLSLIMNKSLPWLKDESRRPKFTSTPELRPLIAARNRQIFEAYLAVVESPEGWQNEKSDLYFSHLEPTGLRDIFVTDTGAIGISREALQVGDPLYYLEDAVAFWAIRRTSSRNRIVASAFIHGLEYQTNLKERMELLDIY